MKKIYYLLAFMTFAFTACQKEPALHSVMPSEVKSLTITLQASDYQLLPSNDYPHSTLTIDDDADAQKYIPIILNQNYANLDNGSTAAVTYAKSALYFKPAADSVYSDVAYTLTSADYLLLPGNTFTDFSIAQALKWLPYKYPTPVANQLVLLTFTPFPATLTPPYSFMYTNGAWKEIYTITPAEYASVGLGKFNQFSSSNNPNIPSMLGALVKSDITIQDTIKKGDIVYVSYNYFVNSTTDYQRVQPLVYDGNNYTVPQASTGTVNFIKQGGAWTYVKPLPVIAYTLTAADITLIANSTIGSSGQRSNLASYGDFSGWSAADLQLAMILVLTTDFKTPQTNTNYNVTYLNYTGGSDVKTVLKFQWNGTAWVPSTAS
ncbi:hypothetical protein ACPPVU_17195 [Mucilaginibacter sp. McL0603]|uniref:hypothetical protein n=1 Tax=Mucilaginibacter sp. McL0603 TaxID=3415670 RepID=UPI003CED5FCD